MLDAQNQGPQCTACGSPAKLTAIEPSALGQDLRIFTFPHCRKGTGAYYRQHRHRGLIGDVMYLRIPEKATTLSGAWRPRDPVDDDQGGARA